MCRSPQASVVARDGRHSSTLQAYPRLILLGTSKEHAYSLFSPTSLTFPAGVRSSFFLSQVNPLFLAEGLAWLFCVPLWAWGVCKSRLSVHHVWGALSFKTKKVCMSMCVFARHVCVLVCREKLRNSPLGSLNKQNEKKVQSGESCCNVLLW